jgi:hypothetical protein
MARTTLRLRIVFPWWWRLYVQALLFSAWCGVLRPNPAIAAAFIIKHTRFETF